MRLLFLHGFQQSPAIIQEETGFLQPLLSQIVGEEVEFVYPAAPFPSTPRDSGEPTYSWWPEDGNEEYRKTFAYLSDILDRDGPFTGAVGFSQGATLACLIAALLEKPQADRPEAFTSTHEPFRFVLSFSGYREDDPRVQQYYAPGINTPVLHFINSTDPILAEDRCLRLVNSCIDSDGRVVSYAGEGHRVPATKKAKMALGRFLQDVLEQ